MQKELHPNYSEKTVVCACGNSFATRSTYHGDTLKIDVCNACHPFYTGKHKIVDTGGRVEKFMSRYGQLNKNAKKTEQATDTKG